MRTIRITGKGKIKLKPDLTRITISLSGKYRDYEKTIEKSSADTATLKSLLANLGFDPSDIRTLYFDLNAEFESYQKHGTWQQRFSGYRYQHTLKCEFPSDNNRLGRILYELANCPVNPEFRISYTVSDPESAKNRLLGEAVKDASVKADVLTKSAGVSLKDIQSIDYSWGEINFEVSPVNRSFMAPTASLNETAAYPVDIEPNDIEVTDTVTVVWEIA